MKIIETQRLSIEAVRNVCIKADWYTKGDNEDYDKMFKKVKALRDKQIITADDLYPIALDIHMHNNTDDTVEYIMYVLATKINRFFDIVEE